MDLLKTCVQVFRSGWWQFMIIAVVMNLVDLALQSKPKPLSSKQLEEIEGLQSLGITIVSASNFDFKTLLLKVLFSALAVGLVLTASCYTLQMRTFNLGASALALLRRLPVYLGSLFVCASKVATVCAAAFALSVLLCAVRTAIIMSFPVAMQGLLAEHFVSLAMVTAVSLFCLHWIIMIPVMITEWLDIDDATRRSRALLEGHSIPVFLITVMMVALYLLVQDRLPLVLASLMGQKLGFYIGHLLLQLVVIFACIMVAALYTGLKALREAESPDPLFTYQVVDTPQQVSPAGQLLNTQPSQVQQPFFQEPQSRAAPVMREVYASQQQSGQPVAAPVEGRRQGFAVLKG
jgi:hypothetical protein